MVYEDFYKLVDYSAGKGMTDMERKAKCRKKMFVTVK